MRVNLVISCISASVFVGVLALAGHLRQRRLRKFERVERHFYGLFETFSKENRSRRSGDSQAFARLVVGLVFFLVGAFLGLPLVVSSALFLFGFALTSFAVAFRRQKKLQTLESQLEMFLLNLSSAIKAGSTFAKSLALLSDECEDPLRSELNLMLRELDLGVDLSHALDNFAARNPARVVDLFANSVKLHLRTGGELPRVLESCAKSIRGRNQLFRQLKALTSQQRMQALIVSAFPLVFILVVKLLNPSYLEYLNTPAGMAILSYAVVSEVLGFVLINRITGKREDI